MKTINLISLIILFSVGQLSAQDVIVLKNRARIEADSILVKQNTLTYLDYNSEDGQRYSLALSQVNYILNPDGTKVGVKSLIRSQQVERTYGRNLITFYMLDFLYSRMAVSYEHVFSSGKAGVEIPLVLGYGDPPVEVPLPLPIFSSDGVFANMDFAERFGLGVNLNIYPTGQGPVRYFFGPGLMYGNGVYNDSYQESKAVNTEFIAFRVTNGFRFMPMAHLAFELKVDIGIHHLTNLSENPTKAYMLGACNIAYRF